jgi:hypothetical protein
VLNSLLIIVAFMLSICCMISLANTSAKCHSKSGEGVLVELKGVTQQFISWPASCFLLSCAGPMHAIRKTKQFQQWPNTLHDELRHTIILDHLAINTSQLGMCAAIVIVSPKQSHTHSSQL